MLEIGFASDWRCMSSRDLTMKRRARMARTWMTAAAVAPRHGLLQRQPVKSLMTTTQNCSSVPKAVAVAAALLLPTFLVSAPGASAAEVTTRAITGTGKAITGTGRDSQ